VVQADSLGTLNNTLRAIDDKLQAQRQEEMQHAEKLKQMENEQRTKEKQMSIDHEAMEAEKDRRTEIMVAEIRAAGFGAMQDIDANKQSDYLDFLDREQKTSQYQETMNIEREKENNKTNQFLQKQAMEKAKLDNQLTLKEMDMAIARENKNKFDAKPKQPAKKK